MTITIVQSPNLNPRRYARAGHDKREALDDTDGFQRAAIRKFKEAFPGVEAGDILPGGIQKVTADNPPQGYTVI
jgi:hypothetical protein